MLNHFLVRANKLEVGSQTEVDYETIIRSLEFDKRHITKKYEVVVDELDDYKRKYYRLE